MSTNPADSRILRIDQNARRSRAVVANGVAYLAGQVADSTGADITQQTSEVLRKIDALLERCGTSKTRLLTAQIWLASMEDFAAMNSVWDAWVSPGEAPTRCCGQVALADPAYRIEIVVSALLG